jgi:hypothetical protein
MAMGGGKEEYLERDVEFGDSGTNSICVKKKKTGPGQPSTTIVIIVIGIVLVLTDFYPFFC